MDDPIYYCEHCQDTQLEHPNCETCKGFGWIEDPSDGGTMSCPECDGEPCQTCGGL